MTTQTMPTVQQLPTSKQLWKATGISVVVAAVLLVTVVLPAEHGIDPTRIGSALGLTKMSGAGATSTATATESAAPAATASASVDSVVKHDAPFKTESATVTLPPGKGTEIKATMKAGEQFVFTWTADGPVNFDLHGEPPNAGDKFTSHWKDRQQTSGHGSFTAPFDGTHGWWWGNKSDKPINVTVTVAGYFEKIGKP